ncbi:clasp N terminal-domain-containing protein [Terfezia claveryi]|nr:clasp N terminal-domain-containing protein [Terfezia claveryi]
MSMVTLEQAQDLLNLMHSNKDPDVKTTEIQKIKGLIKQSLVQNEGIAPLCEALRIGLASTNVLLFQHTFSCIGHLIKRLGLQDPKYVRAQFASLLPVFVDKLGDSKVRINAQALSCVLDMYKHLPAETEKAVKEHGMQSKSPRTREHSVNWLMRVYSQVPGFSFRSYTPLLMKMLEDADAAVRDNAKEAVVELFKNAPDHAKADLKKELARNGVRKAIATYIVSQLGIPGGAAEAEAMASGAAGEGEGPSGNTGPNKAKSVAGGNPASRFLETLPGTELEVLDPEYVNTNRELEEIFAGMVACFDGRESEQNWLAREKSCTRIRRLARGNAYKDYQQTFLAGLKTHSDGILKSVNSLRTTLSTNGCQLVKDLAIICGPGMDPMAELLLMNLIKLCANTKKITAQMGQVTTAILLANISYQPKILNHVWGAVQDKNVQPRSFATGWLRLLIEAHADHKGYLEHTGGLDVIEKCIKRGLADANPGVREGMRGTFWKFAVVWPDRADVIMDGLDNTMKKLLEKENPNASVKGSNSRAPTLTRTTTAPVTRPSIKEAILAQKRQQAQMAKLQRPDMLSAQIEAPPAPASTHPAGLSSAPVRPTRPKIRAAPEGAAVRSTPANIGSGERAAANRAVSPVSTHSSTKETSVHFSRRSPQPPGSPPQSLRMAKTPLKQQGSQLSTKKMSLVDQLNHPDWRVRAEGVVTVACLIAKRTPPNYDGSKVPTLPPASELAPILQKLVNDPQSEVVEHILAPEVLEGLYKLVPMDMVVPKVLLLAEGDDEGHAQSAMQSTMPVLKSLLTLSEATDLLFRILTSMGAFGTVPRKLIPTTPYTNSQKKKVIHGSLIWLKELVDLVVDGNENEFIQDVGNYKTYVSRLLAMLSQTKAPNYQPLALLLKSLRKIDQPNFDKILGTFERAIVSELKRTWGQPLEEEEFRPMEEKVAHVQEVLGEVPVISPSSLQRFRHISPVPMSPRSRKREFSPTEIKRDVSRSASGAMPAPPQTPPRVRPKSESEDKENKEAQRTPEKSLEQLQTRNGAATKLTFAEASVVHDSSGGEQQRNTEWYRARVKKQISNSNLPKAPEHTARLLQTLIEKVRARDMDTQSFRKLINIAREHPVRVLRENNGEEATADIWEGGRMFDELMEILLEFLRDDDLDPEKSADLRVQGLLVLKQLTRCGPYLSAHEAAILTTLIDLRGKYPTQSHVTTGIEDISDEFLASVDTTISIDAVLNTIQPADKPASYTPPIQGWCMGLALLGKLVKASKLEKLEQEMGRLGKVAVKGMGAQDSEVRRNCVDLCVALNKKVGDEARLFEEVLVGLESGIQNLLTYYFVKHRKD